MGEGKRKTPRPPKGTRWGGRQKGTPNKVTRETREAFKMLFDGLVPELESWIRRTAKKSPDKAAKLVVEIAEHFIPKLSRQEIVGEGGGPLVVEVVKYVDDVPSPTSEKPEV